MIEENYMLPLLAVVELSIMFLATLAVLFYLSPLVTACLLAGMALMFLIPALLGKALAKREEKVSQQTSTFTAKTKDFLSGYEIIRGFGILPHTRKVFAAEIENNLLSQEYLTLLTITHNLNPALLGQYDEIIYMEEGKIAAKGSLNQLLATDDKFREFYEGAPNAPKAQEA